MRVIGPAGVGEPAERGDEDVLGDVLGQISVAGNAERDPHDRGILLAEEPLERRQRRPRSASGEGADER